MQKRTSKLDTVQDAKRAFDEAISRTEGLPQLADSATISQVMAQMGARGGRIGGKRRLETMTKSQRTEVARNAAKARWSKKRKKKS